MLDSIHLFLKIKHRISTQKNLQENITYEQWASNPPVSYDSLATEWQ